MQKKERVQQLQRIPLFADCSKRELGHLATNARVEQLDAGHTMFVEGSSSPNLYLLLAGQASVRRNGRKIASIGPGDTVGELGVILGEARNATVTSETAIEMLVLDQRSLRAAMNDVPALGWKLLQTVTARLTEANSRET